MKSPAAPEKQKEIKSRSTPFYIILAASLYVIIHAYSFLSSILLSFLLIILITLALNPLISRMRAWTGSRKQAIILILSGLLALGALIGWFSAIPLKESVMELSEKLPAYWERLQKPLIKMEQQALLTEERLQREVRSEMDQSNAEQNGAAQQAQIAESPAKESPQSPPPPPSTLENGEGSIRSSLLSMIRGASGPLKGVAYHTSDMLIVVITVFFGVTFTLLNPHPIFRAMYALVPEKRHAITLRIMVRIAEFVPNWAGAMLLSMLTIGTLFFLLMCPIFGFTDALILGLIAFLFSAIPFLGPILTLLPALLLALSEGGMTPLWVILAYAAVQALEGNIILPLILSRGMKLHPLAVIFSMLLSIGAFGVFGALIAAPLVAVVYILHEELYRKHFLPTTTNEELAHLTKATLLEERALRSGR